MARLAIFIDGGYLDKLAETAAVRIDYQLFPQEVTKAVGDRTPEPLDLLRTYYYHCLPYQSASPTPEEAERYSRRRRFFEMLRKQSRFEVREGRLAYEGENAEGRPIFRQKRTDLLLGLDFALLSSKRNITHAAVVSGDSDLLPAFDVARQEGISVWLFHGPSRFTYAQELWSAADERYEIDAAFIQRVKRNR